MLTTINPHSYVEQDFIWIGEYADGAHLSEYDIQTKERSDYYKLKRDTLIRFGLIGHGMKLYYEVFGGFFHLNGHIYELVYKVGDKEYYLTGQSHLYNDVIQYKDAESWANFNQHDNRKFPSRILAFNFGYKAKLEIDGIKFNIKPILSVPYNEPIFLDFTLVSDTDLSGKFIIKKNGSGIAEFDTLLEKGVGKRLKWSVR